MPVITPHGYPEACRTLGIQELCAASAINRIRISNTLFYLSQSRKPYESCAQSSGVIQYLKLLSLEINRKMLENPKTSRKKKMFLSGLSKDPIAVCLYDFVLFGRFVEFASNMLQHHTF